MRLIDADLLLKSIEVTPQFDCVGELLKRYIECFPTAYDADKVVKKLKESNFSEDWTNDVVYTDDATEIVKSGGVADD